MADSIARVILVISLSVNVFLFASLAMYGTWLITPYLADFWRGIVSLTVWISSFGVGALAFWKIVSGISNASAPALKSGVRN